MPIQRDLIRHKPWNGEISAKNARALAISKLKQTLACSVDTASVPENNQLSLPECSKGKAARSKKPSGSPELGIDTTQSELHLPDESRFYEVITLRKCPICGTKPIVLKHKHFARVVHRDGAQCDFVQAMTPLPMADAKRAWNLAVKLCLS